MKKRLEVDTFFLTFVLLATLVLYWFPGLYFGGKTGDIVFDCLGFLLILKGSLWRMAARGHKSYQSKQGAKVVTSGPYSVSRNPMYLGSFLVGAGFVLLLWPWWILPLFVGIFYWRFQKQVGKEETFLGDQGNETFTKYCEDVPRIIPSYKRMRSLKTKDLISWEESFSTNEKWTFLGWAVSAVILETFQELLVIGKTDILLTLIIFTSTAIIFSLGIIVAYKVV